MSSILCSFIMGKTLVFPKVTLCSKAVCAPNLLLQLSTEPGTVRAGVWRPPGSLHVSSRRGGWPGGDLPGLPGRATGRAGTRTWAAAPEPVRCLRDQDVLCASWESGSQLPQLALYENARCVHASPGKDAMHIFLGKTQKILNFKVMSHSFLYKNRHIISGSNSQKGNQKGACT